MVMRRFQINTRLRSTAIMFAPCARRISYGPMAGSSELALAVVVVVVFFGGGVSEGVRGVQYVERGVLAFGKDTKMLHA